MTAALCVLFLTSKCISGLVQLAVRKQLDRLFTIINNGFICTSIKSLSYLYMLLMLQGDSLSLMELPFLNHCKDSTRKIISWLTGKKYHG